jgi:hypothetical protein
MRGLKMKHFKLPACLSLSFLPSFRRFSSRLKCLLFLEKRKRGGRKVITTVYGNFLHSSTPHFVVAIISTTTVIKWQRNIENTYAMWISKMPCYVERRTREEWCALSACNEWEEKSIKSYYLRTFIAPLNLLCAESVKRFKVKRRSFVFDYIINIIISQYRVKFTRWEKERELSRRYEVLKITLDACLILLLSTCDDWTPGLGSANNDEKILQPNCILRIQTIFAIQWTHPIISALINLCKLTCQKNFS